MRRSMPQKARSRVSSSSLHPLRTRNASGAGTIEPTSAAILTTPRFVVAASRTCTGLARRARMPKWLGLAAVVLVVDQITKQAITRTFRLHESLEIAPFFNLVLVYNRGAAFSFLSDAAGWQRELFIAIALAASVWIAWLLRKHPTQTIFCLALSLILGGAIGNVIDRFVYGAVVDF